MASTDLSSIGIKELCKGLSKLASLKILVLDNNHFDYHPVSQVEQDNSATTPLMFPCSSS